MKKIIGLIMIAGISYGASVVTPPGIQVNGLATNNNVMVYSDGMLLDSGVAPTNLVSVTNLTADIEALSATNAAQDALIAGNFYAEGTTNKTLIDAAIGSRLDNVDFIAFNDDGTVSTYTNIADKIYGSSTTVALYLTNCIAYQLRDISATNTRFRVRGHNFKLNGNGNSIIIENDGYYGNDVFRPEYSSNFELINMDVRGKLSGWTGAYLNQSTYKPYGLNFWYTTNYTVRGGTYEVISEVTPTNSTTDYLKGFVNVYGGGSNSVIGANIIAVSTNNSVALTTYGATHSPLPASAIIDFVDCNFVCNSNLNAMWLNTSADVTFSGCKANIIKDGDTYEGSFSVLPDSASRGLLSKNSKQYWVDDQSSIDSSDDIWHDVSGYVAVASTGADAISGSWGLVYRLDAQQDSGIVAGFAHDNGTTDSMQVKATLLFPDVATSNAIYVVRAYAWMVNDAGTAYTSAMTGKYDQFSVTNNTGTDLIYDLDATITGLTNDIVAVGFTRRYSSESNTAGTKIYVLGGEKVRVY